MSFLILGAPGGAPELCIIPSGVSSPLHSLTRTALMYVDIEVHDDDGPRIDDIKVEYCDGRDPKIFHFEEFGRHSKPSTSTPNQKPWAPHFFTRQDFELADLIRKSRMTQDDADALIKLVKSVTDGKGKFTFTGYNDVQKAWDRASRDLVTVRIHLCFK